MSGQKVHKSVNFVHDLATLQYPMLVTSGNGKLNLWNMNEIWLAKGLGKGIWVDKSFRNCIVLWHKNISNLHFFEPYIVLVHYFKYRMAYTELLLLHPLTKKSAVCCVLFSVSGGRILKRVNISYPMHRGGGLNFNWSVLLYEDKPRPWP